MSWKTEHERSKGKENENEKENKEMIAKKENKEKGIEGKEKKCVERKRDQDRLLF